MDLLDVTAVVPGGAEPWRDGDVFLAGGTWLFSQPQPGVRRLVDLQAFGWPPLVASDAGLEIAATCTLRELAAWTPPAGWPAGRLAARCCDLLLGSFKIRREATVGGNVCLALPAGPMTSLAVALDGECVTSARTLPAAELVTGPQQSALAPGELLRSVRLPAAALASPVAMRTASLTDLGRSAVVVIGRRDGEGLVLTVTAAVPRPLVLRFPAVPDADELVAGLADVGWYDDPHGAPAWRAHLTRRYAEEVRCELA